MTRVKRGNREPLWALAAGCVPDVDPWDIPRVAFAGGFTSCGMWVDPKTNWQGDALAKTRRTLDETGVELVDVEACFLDGTDQLSDHHKALIDAGLALNARNALIVVAEGAGPGAQAQFQSLCERAGDNLRVCLEFGEFTAIKSLAAARDFISGIDHPAAGILIDLMHINRSGEALPDLAESIFPYVQGCDFWQSSAAKTGRDYIVAALDERTCLGEGEANAAHIKALCQAPIDVSLEIRSKPLRDAFPDPVERARQIYTRCQRKAE